MKLNTRILALLVCSVATTMGLTACGEDDSNTDGVGGEGNGSSTGGGDGTGDGPAPSPYQCDDEGGAECTGSASGIVCPEGSTDGVPFTCAAGEVCDDGECVGQCEAGATECVGGSVLRVCTSDGRAWVDVPCAAGETCSEDDACAPVGGIICSPGASDCADDGTVRTCNEAGTGYEESECPGSSTCSDGACKGSVCTVGATQCTAGALNFARSFAFAGVQETDLTTILRCVDGDSWVVETCPEEEDEFVACQVGAVSASEAAEYRADMWAWEVAYYENSGSAGPAPSPPSPGEDHQATCKPLEECTVFGFMASPGATSSCGTDDESDETPWAKYTSCPGIYPFGPDPVVVECSATSVCDDYQIGPFGAERAECVELEPDTPALEGDCYPGEIACANAGAFTVCEWSDGEGSYWSSQYSCPDEGECADAGALPDRHATCDGTPAVIPEPVIVEL